MISTLSRKGTDPVVTTSVMEALLAKGGEGVPSWHLTVYAELRRRLLDEAFPCHFGRQALKGGQLCYGFAGPVEEEANLAHVRLVMLAYLALLRTRSPAEAALSTLVLFIEPEAHPLALDQYREQTFAILQYLHDHDPEPWPEATPTDPFNHLWCFCFAGVPTFLNASTPAHVKRRSRNMGPGLTLVIQPRSAILFFAGNSPHGDRVRTRIREKQASYDSFAPGPQKGTYGDPRNLDWQEIWLGDDAEPIREDEFSLVVRPKRPAIRGGE